MRLAYVNQDRGVHPRKAKGAAVHVVALRQAFERLGIEVLPLDEPDDARLAIQLERQLASGSIDLVYERYALGKDLASRMSVAHGVPHVLEVNAPLLLEATLYRGALVDEADRELERALFRRTSRIVCVSSPLARHVREVAAPAELDVRVEPNAVGPEFLDDPAPPTDFCTRGRFVIGFHGRLRPWHAFDRTVDLVRGLLRIGVDVELALVGAGDFDAAVEDLPADRVVRCGWLDPVATARHVARFDAVVLPYRADAPTWFSPLKLAEAMSVGAVPIVTDAGDLAREVEHGVSGLVVAPDSDTELYAAALELAVNTDLWSRLSDGARRRGRRRTWDDVARRVLDSLATRAVR